MKKVVGYVVSVVGIAVMVAGFGMVDLGWTILKKVDSNFVAGIGIVLIIAGVFISLRAGKSRAKSEDDEVPIYEGVGKKRKIVGYRKR